MAAAVGGFPIVRTALAEILAASERSLLVSRTGILLLMAQLAILAGYAIVLTAALIVDHRRVDTALLRSRGAGPLQVGGLALAEGLLLALPAGLAGPWLAAGALRILNLSGRWPASACRSSRRSRATPTWPPSRRPSRARSCSSCRRCSRRDPSRRSRLADPGTRRERWTTHLDPDHGNGQQRDVEAEALSQSSRFVP